MMEIAFLNAISKSAHMPPYDPYCAGGYINYYYYGLFITNVMIKLTGIVPEVAFNLAVPTFFALTVSHLFSVGYALATGSTRRSGLLSAAGLATAFNAGWGRGLNGGMLAVLLVAVMGNLSGIVQLGERLGQIGGAFFGDGGLRWQDLSAIAVGIVRVVTGQSSFPEFEYWYRGTRIVPFTINEFPFFSFLFADLHPHMMAIPFTVLVIGLLLATLRGRSEGVNDSALRWLLLALAIGALGVINTWDLPTYWGLLACVLLYLGGRALGWRGLLEGILGLLILVLASLLFYAPFYSHYRAQHVGVALVPTAERSPLGPFMLIWGFFIFLLLAVLGFWLGQHWRDGRLGRLSRRYGRWRVLCRLWALSPGSIWRAVASGGLLILGLGLAWYWAWQGSAVLALLTPLLGIAAAVLFQQRLPPEGLLQRLLIFMALAILCGIEIVYLKDFLAASEWRRMNTVFKFGIQAWVLLGLAIGSAIPTLWDALRQHGAGLAGAFWRGAFWLLLGSSLVYTVLAVPARVEQRFPSAWPPPSTLDGTAYMWFGVYTWPDPQHVIELAYDREAIAWLWEHVEGTPVISEAPLGYYREGGLRVASYTGLPTVVGAPRWMTSCVSWHAIVYTTSMLVSWSASNTAARGSTSSLH